jgi:transcription antitermination factor NusG
MSCEQMQNWFAVYTASNNEKRVAYRLGQKDVETFLPMYSVKKRWKNRTNVKVELPLFAGYVFVRIRPSESKKVLEVPMVYSIVGNGRELTPVSGAEIEALRLGLQSREAHPFPYIKVGKRMRIRCGALAGVEGIVVRSYGELSVVLSVDLIQQSVAVHVDADELEPCAERVLSGEGDMQHEKKLVQSVLIPERAPMVRAGNGTDKEVTSGQPFGIVNACNDGGRGRNQR